MPITSYLWGTGFNNSGQLGDETFFNRSSPVQTVATLGNYCYVAKGNNTTVATKDDGTLWVWGDNTSGQLGDNTNIFNNSPIQTYGRGNIWREPAVGNQHTLVTTETFSLFGFGSNDKGQLGVDLNITSTSSPIQIIAVTTNWSFVSCGYKHSAGISGQGLYTWGLNTSGQAGNGKVEEIAAFSSPVQTGTTTTWVQLENEPRSWSNLYGSWFRVSCGHDHTAAIKSNFTLWLWGNNSHGQLGNNTTNSRSSPVQEITGSIWTNVACGYKHTAAIKDDDSLWLWGNNSYGQLGDNTKTHRSSPIQTVASFTVWNYLACGRNITGATNTTGQLWTWGMNSAGELGDNTTVHRSSPVQMIISAVQAVSAAAGFGVINGTIPQQTFGKPPVVVDRVDYTYKFNANLLVWGGNYFYQLGTLPMYDSFIYEWVTKKIAVIPLSGNYTTRPQKNLLGGDDWYKICFAEELNRQPVYYQAKDPRMPAANDLVDTYKARDYDAVRDKNIFFNTVALKKDGSLYQFGRDFPSLNLGGLGGILATQNFYENSGNSAFYTQVEGVWKDVSCGDYYVAGIKNDGSLWTWGYNFYGQLADYTPNFYQAYLRGSYASGRFTPTEVEQGKKPWRSVSCSTYFFIALTESGTVYFYGQKGPVAFTSDQEKNFPIIRGELIQGNIKKISAGYNHFALLTTEGQVVLYGVNELGQLGEEPINNTQLDQMWKSTGRLLKIMSYNFKFKDVSCGQMTTAVITQDGTLYTFGPNMTGASPRDGETRYGPYRFDGSYKTVSLGRNFGTAITTDGTMYSWGTDGFEQKLNSFFNRTGYGFDFPIERGAKGTSQYKSDNVVNLENSTNVVKTPLKVSIPSPWVDIATGSNRLSNAGIYNLGNRPHKMNIHGILFAWGSNSNGELGDGTTTNRSKITQVTGQNFNWHKVWACDNGFRALKSDNTIHFWGNGVLTPTQISLNNNEFLAGGADKYIYTQKKRVAYILSISPNNNNPPVYYGFLSGGLSDLKISKLVSSKYGSTMGGIFEYKNRFIIEGIKNWRNYFDYPIYTPRVYLFNSTNYGQAPDGTLLQTDYFAEGTNSFTNNFYGKFQVSKIAISDNHTIVTDDSGILYSAGLNLYGQLGHGTNTNKTYYKKVLTSGIWIDVAAGGNVSAAIKDDGSLWMWGQNNYGQLGDGTNSDRNYPALVSGYNKWQRVVTDGESTVALTTTGLLFAWGRNDKGQLAQGDTTTYYTAKQIESNYVFYDIIVGNDGQFLALAYSDAQQNPDVEEDATIIKSSRLWGVGANNAYQLGDETNVSKSSPIQTSLYGYDWVKSSSNNEHNAALKADGSLWMWGSNAYGKLGNNSTATASKPVFVMQDKKWAKISVGKQHTAGINIFGELWSWGKGTYGALGASSVEHRSSPIQSNTWGIWKEVACGDQFTAAIRQNIQSMFLWGDNSFGQIGRSTAVSYYSSPIQEITLGQNWRYVTTGSKHVLGLKVDGTLWSWGKNAFGQLGDNSVVHRSSPVQVLSNQGSWVAIACGDDHSIGLDKNGKLWTWGLNAEGQLGDNTTNSKSSPVQTISLGTTWRNVYAGYKNLAGIKSDGTIWIWGDNSQGQLGDNTTASKSSPVQLASSFRFTWTSISLGKSVFAIDSGNISVPKEQKTLWMWGDNDNYRLGDTTTTNRNSPIQTYANGSNWSVISLGSKFSGAVKTDGTLWLWGNNSYGQLGNYGFAENDRPRLLNTGGSNWSEIICGSNFVIATQKDGTVWSWGCNKHGQLGNLSFSENVPYPATNINFEKNNPFISLSCGNDYAAGIKSDGTLWTWGYNTFGNLGDNTTIHRNSPVQVGLNNIGWKVVSCGSIHAAAIANDGSLWTWGYNAYDGRLGNNTLVHKSSPVQTIAGGKNWSMVSCGGGHTVAIKKDGSLWAWGGNVTGNLGLNDTYDRSSPVQVIGSATNWRVAEALANCTLAIKNDGTLWTWGNDTYGMLGQGYSGKMSSPVQTLALGQKWAKLGRGSTAFHAGAIYDLQYADPSELSGGSLYSWGSNASGLVGDGTGSDRSSPVQTSGGGTTWYRVASGKDFKIALKTDKTAWAWGNNSHGQLGTNTSTNISAPSQINNNNLKEYAEISAGSRFTASIKTDGSLWCWGENKFGQLGNNTANDKSSPVQTCDLSTGWYKISCGYDFMGGIKNDGSLWMWGNNLKYTLGDATKTPQSSPVQTYRYGNNWLDIACGKEHVVALDRNGWFAGWGSNIKGQLGFSAVLLDYIDFPYFSYVEKSVYRIVKAGDFFTAGIKNDGTLWLFGENESGQLGDGTSTNRSSPIQVIGGGNTWAEISPQGSSMYALKSNGTLWVWGDNTNGKLGNNSTNNISSPVQIYNTNKWTEVGGSLAVLSTVPVVPPPSPTPTTIPGPIPSSTPTPTESKLFLWGDNGYGQLGNNASVIVNSPIQTIALGTSWIYASCGGSHAGAIKNDGTLWMWGLNSSGQLGRNTSNVSSPVQTISFGSNWSVLSCGANSTAAIKSNGTLWMWGDNKYGGLGTEDTVNRSSPVETIALGTNWQNVSCGFFHTAGIKSDGTLWLWGYNFAGQLGDNTEDPKSSPVQTITFGTNWQSVSCGGYFTAAVKTDGTLWSWGRNFDGQLGNNANSDCSSPVQTKTFATNWASVSCGSNFTVAMKTDGTAWLWGKNYSGQLGDGTNSNKSSPVQTISAGKIWTSVVAGYGTAYGLKKNGTIWAWGDNSKGNVGIGTLPPESASYNSPVQVSPFTNNWYAIFESKGASAAAIDFGIKTYDSLLTILSSKVSVRASGIIINGFQNVSLNFNKSNTRLLPAKTMKIFVNNIQKASASFDKSYVGESFVFTDTTGIYYYGTFNADGEIRFT